jgi:hypothetical protein
MTTHPELDEYQRKRQLTELYLLQEALEEQELAGQDPSFERAAETVLQWLLDAKMMGGNAPMAAAPATG